MMVTSTGYRASAHALDRLREVELASPRRNLLRYFFGAPLTRPGDYWYNHVLGVDAVESLLLRLHDQGYLIIADLRVPGTHDDLLDFLVLSPRGTVYAIIAHHYGRCRVVVNRDIVRAHNRAFEYREDLEVKADAVANHLREQGVPFREVVPLLVVTEPTSLVNRLHGRMRAVSDYALLKFVRGNEDRLMRVGEPVLRADARVVAPEFWPWTSDAKATTRAATAKSRRWFWGIRLRVAFSDLRQRILVSLITAGAVFGLGYVYYMTQGGGATPEFLFLQH